MIIGLFGLSGSGKSSLRYAFEKKHSNFYCTSASELLKKLNRTISLQSLNTYELNTNQNILVSKINHLATTYKNIFIELHAIIESQNDKTYIVDKTTLQSLNLDYIFILDTPAQEILIHRMNDPIKKRPSISLDEITRLANLQSKYLKKIYANKVQFIKCLEDIENIVFI